MEINYGINSGNIENWICKNLRENIIDRKREIGLLNIIVIWKIRNKSILNLGYLVLGNRGYYKDIIQN